MSTKLRQVQVDEGVCLVLNGDLIDTLAEDELRGYVALDAGTALQIMDHLYTDPSFAPVWTALGDFVTAGGHLVITLGNHDLELALPVVQRSIRTRLGGDAAQIEFATSGGGYTCQVGEATVFCTHGNEVDDWNLVDYTQLGWLANATNAGRTVDASKWEPNAGTRLVVDVMNKVKREHPFVDLLKPETSPLISVLLTIDDDIIREVDWSAAFPILSRKLHGGMVNRKILSATDDLSSASNDAVAEEASRQLLGSSLSAEIENQSQGESKDDLLLQAGVDAADPDSAPALTASGADRRTLGWFDILKGKVGLLSPVESLRLALQDWIDEDKTFDVRNAEDALFQEMQDRVADGVHFVCTGHTHSAQSLSLPGGRRYFNSGTWVRLLRLTPELLSDKAAFAEEAYPALRAGTMDRLDGQRIPGTGGKTDMVIDRTNFLKFIANGNTVTGSLMRATGVDDGHDLGTEIQEGSEPTVMGF